MADPLGKSRLLPVGEMGRWGSSFALVSSSNGESSVAEGVELDGWLARSGTGVGAVCVLAEFERDLGCLGGRGGNSGPVVGGRGFRPRVDRLGTSRICQR